MVFIKFACIRVYSWLNIFMILTVLKLLSCPIAVLSTLMGVSAFALIAAFASEAFLGLEPCQLCIYQRWPFAVVIAIGIIGMALKTPGVAVGLSGIAMLVNSGIAFYHTGIEQKWWISAVEGCTVPNFGDTPQSILDNILSAPTARCDEIPWQDPILGLSMANYNVLLCLGLVLLCGLHLLLRTRRAY